MMYKLIALDYDGTLVDESGILRKKDVQIIKKLLSLGIVVLIATGRNFTSIYGPINRAGLVMPLISNNGNIVRDLRTNEMVYKKALNTELVYLLIEILDELDIEPIMHIDGFHKDYDIVLLKEPSLATRKYVGFYDNRYRIKTDGSWVSEDVLSFVAYMTEEEFDYLYTKVLAKFPKTNAHILNLNYNGKRLLEVVGESTSKWTGVTAMAQHLGINPYEIIAAGDDANDITMVQEAGLGIALADADPRLIKVADLVTDYTSAEQSIFKTILPILDLEDLV